MLVQVWTPVGRVGEEERFEMRVGGLLVMGKHRMHRFGGDKKLMVEWGSVNWMNFRE